MSPVGCERAVTRVENFRASSIQLYWTQHVTRLRLRHPAMKSCDIQFCGMMIANDWLSTLSLHPVLSHICRLAYNLREIQRDTRVWIILERQYQWCTARRSPMSSIRSTLKEFHRFILGRPNLIALCPDVSLTTLSLRLSILLCLANRKDKYD